MPMQRTEMPVDLESAIQLDAESSGRRATVWRSQVQELQAPFRAYCCLPAYFGLRQGMLGCACSPLATSGSSGPLV